MLRENVVIRLHTVRFVVESKVQVGLNHPANQKVREGEQQSKPEASDVHRIERHAIRTDSP